MYTTVARVRNRLGNVTVAAISDALITEEIETADGLIDSFLSSRYTIPLVTVSHMIRGFSEQIAAYYVVSDMMTTGAVPSGGLPLEDNVIFQRYRDVMKKLEMIRDGKLKVPDAPAISDSNSVLYSSTQNKKTFFNIDHETSWGFDEDDLDNVLDDRDDKNSMLPGEKA